MNFVQLANATPPSVGFCVLVRTLIFLTLRLSALQFFQTLIYPARTLGFYACFDKNENPVTLSGVESTIVHMARQSGYAFETLLASLSPVQQRVLRLAAIEGKRIFSKETMQKYEITSAPHITQALKTLQNKQILDEVGTRDGLVIFDDPLFRIWLRAQFMAQ